MTLRTDVHLGRACRFTYAVHWSGTPRKSRHGFVIFSLSGADLTGQCLSQLEIDRIIQFQFQIVYCRTLQERKMSYKGQYSIWQFTQNKISIHHVHCNVCQVNVQSCGCIQVKNAVYTYHEKSHESLLQQQIYTHKVLSIVSSYTLLSFHLGYTLSMTWQMRLQKNHG